MWLELIQNLGLSLPLGALVACWLEIRILRHRAKTYEKLAQDLMIGLVQTAGAHRIAAIVGPQNPYLHRTH